MYVIECNYENRNFYVYDRETEKLMLFDNKIDATNTMHELRHGNFVYGMHRGSHTSRGNGIERVCDVAGIKMAKRYLTKLPAINLRVREAVPHPRFDNDLRILNENDLYDHYFKKTKEELLKSARSKLDDEEWKNLVLTVKQELEAQNGE